MSGRNGRGDPHGFHASQRTQLRTRIASTAARLIAVDGITDYELAKKKAARQLGVNDSDALPNNSEIDDELRIYHAIYQQDEHKQRINELRRKALDLMRQIPQFHPYLTGSVLDGTAGRFADIDILLFVDSAKEVEIFLLNRQIDFEHATPRHDRVEAVLQCEWQDATVNLVVYPGHDERVTFRHRDGRVRERARPDALAALLEATRDE